MKIFKQRDYAHVPYRINAKKEGISEEERQSTVHRAGCGLCCACTMVELLSERSLSIEECVRMSEEHLANHSKGTDMGILAPVVAAHFDLLYTTTNDLDVAIRHLQEGGAIIALMGVPKGAEIGLFTKGGHYISLISTNGKEFCILDPSYSPEKFARPERCGRINVQNAPFLYADVATVDSETKQGFTKYHLFARKKKDQP